MRAAVVMVSSVAGFTGCGGGSAGTAAPDTVATTTLPPSSAVTAAPEPAEPVTTPTTTVPPTTKPAPAGAPPATRARTPAAPAAAAPEPPAGSAPMPPFEGSVRPIDDGVAARMTASWRPGCPVGLGDLRLLTVSHWGFDSQPHLGELVVSAQHADAVLGVFSALYGARFPMEQVRLVDEFGADDDRSMEANNTSAFNCRRVAGSDRWSEHAFGTAIDINPVQNPSVTRSGVSPPAGAAYTSRNASTPGLITADGPVVAAFRAIGWGWGGSWSSGKDYQHFSASGR